MNPCPTPQVKFSVVWWPGHRTPQLQTGIRSSYHVSASAFKFPGNMLAVSGPMPRSVLPSLWLDLVVHSLRPKLKHLFRHRRWRRSALSNSFVCPSLRSSACRNCAASIGMTSLTCIANPPNIATWSKGMANWMANTNSSIYWHVNMSQHVWLHCMVCVLAWDGPTSYLTTKSKLEKK